MKYTNMCILIILLLCSCDAKISEEHVSEVVYTEGLEYVLNETKTGYYVSNGSNLDTIVNVPPYYNDLPIVGVGFQGFSQTALCVEFEQINLPDSVEDIAESAFWGCEKLDSFTFPKSLKTIGMMAFSYCTSLKEVILPEGLKKVEDYAFSGLESLEKISFPDTLEYIGVFGIENLENKLAISNMNNDGYYFGNNNNPYMILSAIDVKDKEFTVNEKCKFFNISKIYEGNEKLEVIKLSKNVRFLNSTIKFADLKMISGECLIKYISPYTFTNSTNLEEIPSLKYCEVIGRSAFENCSSLTGEIDLSSICDLDFYAFSNCNKITKVILKGKLKVIKPQVFKKCVNLETIYISKNIDNIMLDAFSDCNNLKTIYYEGSEDDWKLINIDTSNLKYINNANIIYNSF